MSKGLPFRAEHVGSLLRPEGLKDARRRFAARQIDRDDLTAIEDAAIIQAIAKQEEIGFHAVTDGEYRRSWWHLDFLEGLSGVEKYQMEGGMAFSGVNTKAEGVRVTAPIAFDGHPMVSHFKFLSAHTNRVAKQCIPSPSALYGRRGREAVDHTVYPSIDRFWGDLGDTYRKAINAFVAAGCSYIQLDEVYLVMLCDDDYRRKVRDQGDDPDALAKIYGDLINAALADVPDDVTTAIHMCRGNFKSTFLGSGAYDTIASVLFDRINVDGYFMEYDTERAGGFEPLARLPKDRRAVLGIVSSKIGEPEAKDAIKARVYEAARFASLDQLCLSPQCGFASTEEGNVIAKEQQWSKLRSVVRIAGEIWS
ncbi:MAG: 5-methyltetrahydropteroyltriglutamate--homocysteine S-methyltransferase [Alphaproteobacteria bacterium]